MSIADRTKTFDAVRNRHASRTVVQFVMGVALLERPEGAPDPSEGKTMDDALLREVRDQNSRLEQLIETICHLLTRSRELLIGQRPEKQD